MAADSALLIRGPPMPVEVLLGCTLGRERERPPGAEEDGLRGASRAHICTSQ